jgi:hypothetical protein
MFASMSAPSTGQSTMFDLGEIITDGHVDNLWGLYGRDHATETAVQIITDQAR